jgi:hypothetical protein
MTLYKEAPEHSSRHHAAGQPHTLYSGKVLTMTVYKEAPEHSSRHHAAGQPHTLYSGNVLTF